MIWASLASELRELILESLVQDEGSLAPYATVCREWQRVVEKKNFGRLKLTVPRLADFTDMVCRRRKFVKYIWLCVELNNYNCSVCDHRETDARHENNTYIIKWAVRELFFLLSSWEPAGKLVLDVSVHSPSDARHHFKYLRFTSDSLHECKSVEEALVEDDRRHGWANGKQATFPPKDALFRLFEDIEMEPDFWDEIPPVPAVTGLLLRRQTRRRWEPGAIGELLKLLPGLEEIYYEPWREWGRMDQEYTDESTHELFASLAPITNDNNSKNKANHDIFTTTTTNSLKKMVLFEDFRDEYITMFQGVYEPIDADPIRSASPAVSSALALASLPLHHLSASYLVDAAHFFPEPSLQTWTWPNLTSLTLTSRTLDPTTSPSDINALLQTAAATAAASMPRLANMQLWNGGRGLACVFRYAASRDYQAARLTWKATFDVALESRTIRAWEAVAQGQGACEVVVIKQWVGDSMGSVANHGDAMRRLGGLENVVHPVSLRQICLENGP